MAPIITYLLIVFLGLFGLLIIIELVLYRAVTKFIIQTAILLAVIVVLNMTTGFPSVRLAFGGVTSIIIIGIMFLCTLLGIAGHYFYYLKGKIVWRTFLKPFIISPIVLLPLIGTVQKTSDAETVQIISFGILAFQNGFFWREVFEHAKRKI